MWGKNLKSCFITEILNVLVKFGVNHCHFVGLVSVGIEFITNIKIVKAGL